MEANEFAHGKQSLKIEQRGDAEESGPERQRNDSYCFMQKGGPTLSKTRGLEMTNELSYGRIATKEENISLPQIPRL